MINTERTIKSKTIYDGKIIKVELLDVIVNEKSMHKREIVKHSKGVGILAKNNNNEFILVEQFRKPYENGIIEVPAGKVDEGEDIKQAALRELQEEIGYTSNKVIYLGEHLPSPGFTDEVVYLYYTDSLIKEALEGDEDENFNIYTYSEEQLKEAIINGKITDGKTLAAYLYYTLMIK